MKRVTVHDAVVALKQGQLVVFPTETVYGIGADAFDATAVAAVFDAKKRVADKPLSLHVSSIEMARECVTRWPDNATRLTERFWPGPLTLVLPAGPHIPSIVRAGGDTVGLRAPDQSMFTALVEEFGHPIVGTSANLSGTKSPVCLDEVPPEITDDPRVVCLDDGPCTTGVESTVITLNDDGGITVLREAAITREQIEHTLSE